MSNFEQRLQKAIERGHRLGDEKQRAETAQAMSEEQCKRLHSQYRLQLSEHIERCLSKLPQHFPGFQFETVFGERGWGATVNRDDVGIGPDGRRNYFSRLEMAVRPYSSSHVLDLAARGTIRNKEVYNRSHFQMLSEVDIDSFKELVDLWVLEYAELYAAKK